MDTSADLIEAAQDPCRECTHPLTDHLAGVMCGGYVGEGDDLQPCPCTSPTPMDWRALLVLYMLLVAEAEGTTFVRYASTTGTHGTPKLTEAEVVALRKIDEEIDAHR